MLPGHERGYDVARFADVELHSRKEILREIFSVGHGSERELGRNRRRLSSRSTQMVAFVAQYQSLTSPSRVPLPQ